MKWKGEIEVKDSVDYGDFKELGIITLKDGLYHISHYMEFSDGSVKTLISGLWANSLGAAKRRLNIDTEYAAKNWNWVKIE